jgi:hypothetical protein
MLQADRAKLLVETLDPNVKESMIDMPVPHLALSYMDIEE